MWKPAVSKYSLVIFIKIICNSMFSFVCFWDLSSFDTSFTDFCESIHCSQLFANNHRSLQDTYLCSSFHIQSGDDFDSTNITLGSIKRLTFSCSFSLISSQTLKLFLKKVILILIIFLPMILFRLFILKSTSDFSWHKIYIESLQQTVYNYIICHPPFILEMNICQYLSMNSTNHVPSHC